MRLEPLEGGPWFESKSTGEPKRPAPAAGSSTRLVSVTENHDANMDLTKPQTQAHSPTGGRQSVPVTGRLVSCVSDMFDGTSSLTCGEARLNSSRDVVEVRSRVFHHGPMRTLE